MLRGRAGLVALIDDEGYELTGSRVDFEMLAGFVAGDANHFHPGAQSLFNSSMSFLTWASVAIIDDVLSLISPALVQDGEV